MLHSTPSKVRALPFASSPARDAPVTSRSVALTVSDDIARLVLCRTDTRNAISPAVLTELERALDVMEQAGSVKILVLSGEGEAFSVGVDQAAIEALPHREVRQFFRRGRALIRRIETLKTVTVASINGPALGGGFELALACDLRWAHPRAVFGFPESKHGLIPAWGGIRLLRQHLSSAWSLELLASGDYLAASTAHGLGLVSRIITGTEFDAQVQAAVERLRARDARVLQALKALACASADHPEDRDIAEWATFQVLRSQRSGDAGAPISLTLPETA